MRHPYKLGDDPLSGPNLSDLADVQKRFTEGVLHNLRCGNEDKWADEGEGVGEEEKGKWKGKGEGKGQ